MISLFSLLHHVCRGSNSERRAPLKRDYPPCFTRFRRGWGLCDHSHLSLPGEWLSPLLWCDYPLQFLWCNLVSIENRLIQRLCGSAAHSMNFGAFVSISMIIMKPFYSDWNKSLNGVWNKLCVGNVLDTPQHMFMRTSNLIQLFKNNIKMKSKVSTFSEKSMEGNSTGDFLQAL